MLYMLLWDTKKYAEAEIRLQNEKEPNSSQRKCQSFKRDYQAPVKKTRKKGFKRVCIKTYLRIVVL